MKKSRKAAGPTVTVSLQGRGHNVKAYVLGPKELKTLLAATVEDALYEDNPYSLVGNLCAQAETVTPQGGCPRGGWSPPGGSITMRAPQPRALGLRQGPSARP